MVESEMSISSKDSRNLTESKIIDNEFNEISAQDIINNEFDNLEDWTDEQLNKIKSKCLSYYNNFQIDFPNQKKSKDKESNSYEEESNE